MHKLDIRMSHEYPIKKCVQSVKALNKREKT